MSKKSSGNFRRCLAAVSITALTACGGGGGGEATPNTPPAGFATSLALPADTGLPTPTRTLSTASPGEWIPDLVNAHANAGLGVAQRVLGQLAPSSGHPSPAPCSSGSMMATGSPATSYTYASCTYDGYTFNGTAAVSVGTGTYRLDYTGLAVTGPASNSISTTLAGNTECTISGATVKCVATNTGTSGNEFKWGWDATMANGVANGTHACGCTDTWNVTFYDFTATAGKAIIQGGSGSVAYVTRTSATNYSVRLVVGGVGRDYTLP